MVPAMEQDPIDEAWARVVERWDDDEQHRKFVGLCLSLSRLPEAGRRYREVREGDPERRDEAARRIDKLLSLARSTLEATKDPPPDTNRARRILFVVALVLFCGLILSSTWVLLHIR
jgi:hypothetical protein